MEKKYLLGAIVGDILRTTDLSSLDLQDYRKLTENGSFSGDTVLTLGVAKYIMENMNLYRGPAEKGRSEHRQQILVKTLRELAHKYPDAVYSPACKKWLNSGIQEPMDSNEWSAPIWFSPINLAFEGVCDLESLLRINNEAFSPVLKNDTVLTANKAMTVSQYMIGHDWRDQMLCDFLACMYNMRWLPVHQIPDAVENWRESVINSFKVALSIFWAGDNEFKTNTPIHTISSALCELRYLDALPTVVTPFVTTLIQTNHFSQYEGMLINACRSLLPDNLLEINDKFFEFLEENGILYNYDEEEDEEQEDLDVSEDGTISFDDLIKLLGCSV